MNKYIPRSVLLSFVLLGTIMPLASGAAVALGTPVNSPAGSSFDQRLAQRKAEQNEQLDAKTVTHIQQICVNQQGSIRNLQNKATDLLNKRNAVYQQIDGYVLISIGQLKLATKDTFTLEQNRAVMVQKITDFTADGSNYQQSLGDLLVVNCKADAVGFQALLDTARAYQAQLITQSQGISSYITDTVEPVLQTFGTQLQAKSSTGGQ